MIESFIVEEINEVGEVALVLLIPKYLESIDLKQLKYPITDYSENYYIKDEDFELLYNSVIGILNRNNFGLYQYNKNVQNAAKWEDQFILLGENETIKILLEKRLWIFDKRNPTYFIAEV